MKKFIFLLKLALLSGFAISFLGLLALGVAYFIIAPTLPDEESLRNVHFQIPLRIYSADDKLMAVYGEKRRIPVKLDEVPDLLQKAFISGEDERFFQHPGVDYEGILRAVWYIVKTGKKGPGGSTITMQLARNFFLSFEQTYSRKLTEIFLALKIEQAFTKQEILALYLNKIYLGHRTYGVAAASQVYYGKALNELNLAEMAMVASLPKAPSRINPITNPKRALLRRNYVLRRMFELGHISKSDFELAVKTPDRAYAHGPVLEAHAPYVAEIIRSQAVELLGKEAYTMGYNAYSTIDSKLQKTASNAIRRGLISYDQRHGWRGAELQFDLQPEATTQDWSDYLKNSSTIAGLIPGLVVEVDPEIALIYLKDGQTIPLLLEHAQWARPYITQDQRGPKPTSFNSIVQIGDLVRLSLRPDGNWQLAQLPEIQGAFIAMNPNNGEVVALTGGFDFYSSKFNRATQAKRQPGSSFKPIIYSAALEKGFTAASLINDAPVVFNDPLLEKQWRPENYSQKFFGPTRLREAMTHSRNLVSIRLLREIGSSYAARHAEKFGLSSQELPHDLSLALGSATLAPIKMTEAYATLANGGYKIEPHMLKTIENSDHDIVYQPQYPEVCLSCELSTSNDSIDPARDPALDPVAEQSTPKPAERSLSAANAYIITSIMQDVIKRGTGKKALQLGRRDLAGKTGTTNDQRDAWFSGFNHHLVATAWVGFDQLKPLGKGEVGGRAALPIWIDFMKTALKDIPEQPLNQPDTLVSIRINKKTGLATGPGDPDSMIEVFRPNNAPVSLSDKPQNDESSSDSYDIF